jgi:integrase
MGADRLPPIGVSLSADVEIRDGRPRPYRARVRWIDPSTRRRPSKSESFATPEAAQAWIDAMHQAARGGVDPTAANLRLAEYGEAVRHLALRGLEGKTLDPYLAGWRKRVVPALGHIPVRMITYGAVDRAVHGWIADECGRSTVKNSLAMLSRVMEQAVRDGIVDRNPAKVTGWQHEYRRAEDELDDPRSLALPDWESLTSLAAALVDRSADGYPGWGDVVVFAACTAARIGEVAGVRAGDIDRSAWTWTVRRQTTPSPGGLADKGTKGKRARIVPLIVEIRAMVADRLDRAASPDTRLFVGPRGGRISTAVLRDATHLGRGGHRAGVRAPAAARFAAHRADLDGGRRGTGPRAAEDRRARLADHDAAIPTPRPAVDRRRRDGAERPPVGPPVPKWSPTPSRGVGNDAHEQIPERAAELGLPPVPATPSYGRADRI